MKQDITSAYVRQPLWTQDFILIAIGGLCIAMTNYFLSAAMTIYADKISGSVGYAGLVSGTFFVAALGMRLASGILVDRYGSRPMLIASALLCTAACFCHNFALTIPSLLVCRFLHGVGFSIYTTASITATANITPRERLSEGMGYSSLGLVFATALGPSIALYIIRNNAMSEFHTLFYTATGTCIITFFAMSFVRHGKPGMTSVNKQAIKVSTGERTPVKVLPRTFLGFEKGVVWPAVVGSIMLFALSSVTMFLALYGKTLGWNNVGTFFTVYAVAMLLSRLFAGRIADKHGPDIVMLPAFLLAGISYAAIPFCNKLTLLYMVGFPLGLAHGIFTPQISVFCITRCSKERRGSATSAYAGSLDLGMALGSLSIGVMIENLGYVFSYMFCAGLSLVAMAVYILTLSRWARCN